MQVLSINNIYSGSGNHQHVVLNKQNPSKTTFNGYVNGTYYADEIIELARKYRNSSNWKSILRQDKCSVEYAIKNWHHGINWGGHSDEDNYNRIMLGVFTLGASEVVGNIYASIASQVNNAQIEDTINEVAKCIDDLNKEGR